MTGQLINTVKEFCKTLHTDYSVEYDEASAINLKADYIENDKGLIYIEEVARGEYVFPNATERRYFFTKKTNLEITFCRFSKILNNNAGHGNSPYTEKIKAKISDTRQAIRDRIEEETVLPFISSIQGELRKLSSSITINTFPFTYPPHGRFDSNDVAVTLTLTLIEKASCIKSLR